MSPSTSIGDGERTSGAGRRADGSDVVALLAEERAKPRVGRGGGLRILEERVHLPRDAVTVPDPELVGLRVAAGGPFLLQERHLASPHADHLGCDLAAGGVADAEVAQRSRLATDVEREDHGRVGELELGVVVPDLRRLDAEELSILLDGFGDAADVYGDVKGVGHDALLRVHVT